MRNFQKLKIMIKLISEFNKINSNKINKNKSLIPRFH